MRGSLNGKTEYSAAINAAYQNSSSSSPRAGILSKQASESAPSPLPGPPSPLARASPKQPPSPTSPSASAFSSATKSRASPSSATAAENVRAASFGILARQLSDKNKVKSMLNATGELPGSAARAGARVMSYNGRGAAAMLSSTTTGSFAGLRGRPNGITPEQELQLGEVVVGYGSSSFQGLRDYQEDTVAFLPSSSSLGGGIYDGHGGAQVSKELERVLLQNIMGRINDLTARDQECFGPIPGTIQAAISTAYTSTNADIGRYLTGAMEAGSCAVNFILTRAAGALHLFCANAGDCRAVLYTGPPGMKRAVRLSEDHKPHPQVCPSEIARVTKAGGCVLWGRVQGCLAVSRAFGDKTLQPYVIADPYVSVRPINIEQDSFLYLASDGVTDMIEDAAGCQIVAEQLARGQSSSQAAAALVSAAYQQGSSDNISVVVVRFQRR